MSSFENDGRLVYEIVREVYILPAHLEGVRRTADRFHKSLQRMNFLLDLKYTRESTLCGWMELISVLSEGILQDCGYATRWYMPQDPPCRYFPLHVQALDLQHNRHRFEYSEHCPNELGGYRLW